MEDTDMKRMEDTDMKKLAKQIEQIYFAPESYHPDTPKKEFDVYVDLINLLNTHKNSDINLIKSLFIDLFKEINVKLNFDGFIDYISSYNPNKTPCLTFKFNEKLINDSDKNESDVQNIVTLFKCNECITCGCFKEDHKVCMKYIFNESDDSDDSDELTDTFCNNSCKTCGLSKYIHSCCMSFKFNSDSELCDNCGRDLRAHQDKQKKSNMLPCCYYQSSAESLHTSSDYCTKCIYNETYHKINPFLLMMNDKAFDSFIKCVFEFNIRNLEHFNKGTVNKELTNKVNCLYLKKYKDIKL